MAELNFYLLDKTNAGPFAPYLMPAVRRYIGDGRELIAIGAAMDENSVGAVAAAVDHDVLHLVSLYVDPSVRRQGVGSALLRALGARVNELGLYVESVRTYYMEEDEDTAVIAAFLRSAGFGELEPANRLFSVDTAELHHIPKINDALSMDYQPDPHVRPFSEITPAQLAEIEADPDVLSALKPSNIRFNLMRSASTIWVEDGHVLGWILAYQGVDGEIVLAAACKRNGAPDGCFRHLLYALANRCYMMLGRDYKVYILAINEHAGSLVEKLSGGKMHEYRNFVADTGDELPEWLTDRGDGEQ